MNFDKLKHEQYNGSVMKGVKSMPFIKGRNTFL